MGKSLRMASFSILVASMLISPKKVSPAGHLTKTLSSSIEVFSSLGLCLIVLALKVPSSVAGYLHEPTPTQDDAVERLLALLDRQLVLVHLGLAVPALLDLHLALRHVVVQQVVLPFHLPLALLVLVPAVDLGRAVHIFCEVVHVLLLLLVLRVLRA